MRRRLCRPAALQAPVSSERWVRLTDTSSGVYGWRYEVHPHTNKKVGLTLVLLGFAVLYKRRGGRLSGCLTLLLLVAPCFGVLTPICRRRWRSSDQILWRGTLVLVVDAHLSGGATGRSFCCVDTVFCAVSWLAWSRHSFAS